MNNSFDLSLRMLSAIFTVLAGVGRFLLSLWWVYIPIILLILVRDLWLKHIRKKFIQEMDWVLLEIIPPRQVQKTPQAIEQFFTALHASQSGPNFYEKYFLGGTQQWFSMEMISQGGEIHFLVRTTTFFRDMVEAQIYAQYPEAEIVEVADYIHSVPIDIPNDDYDLWGTEFVFTKEDAYPIRTYPSFEKDILTEEQRIDPLSSLLEAMGKLRQGEHIWIQTLIRPIDDKWKKEGEAVRDRLIKRVADVSEGEIQKEIRAWEAELRSDLTLFLTGKGIDTSKKEDKPKDVNPLLMMTKSEVEIVKAIEDDIAKFGFETIIRFLYIARKDIFNKVSIASVIGSYKQFATQNLNGFKPNSKISTKIDYRIELKGPREVYRKKRVLADYRKRDFVQQSKYIDYLRPFFFENLPILNSFLVRSKPIVLNTEELATIYHYPGAAVRAPLVPKIEAKKGEPPIGLPME